MHKQTTVSKLLPNPFRDLDNYPIDQKKVEELKRSIDDTGFWGNILGRVVGDKIEIAYGHHRLIALKEAKGARAKVDIIVQKLSDADMLRIMARENMEEWRAEATVEHETVRAVVQAFADGKIELEAPKKGAPISQQMQTPSFVMGNVNSDGGHLYTAQSVAKFLGWTQSDGTARKWLLEAFQALAAEELGLVTVAQLQGKKRAEVHPIVDQAMKTWRDQERTRKLYEKTAKQAEKEGDTKRAEAAKAKAKEAQKEAKAKAKSAAKAARAALDRGEGEKGAEDAGKAVRASAKPIKPDVPPHLDDLADRMSSRLLAVLSDDKLAADFEILLQFAEHMSDRPKRDLLRELTNLSTRCGQYQKKLLRKGAKPNVRLITAK